LKEILNKNKSLSGSIRVSESERYI
jgi:hypothetical protein